MVVVTERMKRLGEIAKAAAAAGLPMWEQYQVFAGNGGRLTDINWRNCVSNPNLDTVIPVERPAPAQNEH